GSGYGDAGVIFLDTVFVNLSENHHAAAPITLLTLKAASNIQVYDYLSGSYPEIAFDLSWAGNVAVFSTSRPYLDPINGLAQSVPTIYAADLAHALMVPIWEPARYERGLFSDD